MPVAEHHYKIPRLQLLKLLRKAGCHTIMATAIARVGLSLRKDHDVITMFEGDHVHNLRYRRGSLEYTISGILRIINAKTSACSTVPTTCMPEPYIDEYIDIQSVIIDISSEFNAKLIRISTDDIIDVDSVTTE